MKDGAMEESEFFPLNLRVLCYTQKYLSNLPALFGGIFSTKRRKENRSSILTTNENLLHAKKKPRFFSLRWI